MLRTSPRSHIFCRCGYPTSRCSAIIINFLQVATDAKVGLSIEFIWVFSLCLAVLFICIIHSSAFHRQLMVAMWDLRQLCCAKRRYIDVRITDFSKHFRRKNYSPRFGYEFGGRYFVSFYLGLICRTIRLWRFIWCVPSPEVHGLPSITIKLL